MNCGGGGKSQPVVNDNPPIYPICQAHVKYIEYLRGWAFVFKKEIDIINIAREYDLTEELLDIARKRKVEIETEIVHKGLKDITIEAGVTDSSSLSEKSDDVASSVPMMMEDYSSDEF
jgi:hypothetical protein